MTNKPLPPDAPTKILVLGGGGFIGQSVVEKLVERSGGGSAVVRVPVRRLARGRHLQLLPTVQTIEADVMREGIVEQLVSGMHAVINLIGLLYGSEQAFDAVNVKFVQRVARACQTAGVKRLIHISTLGASPQAPSLYYRSKGQGEAVALQSGLQATVVRPSAVFGERDQFINVFAAAQAVRPVMVLAGNANAKFQPVWVDDLAQAIVGSLDDARTVGEPIECAGPQVFTMRQLVRAAGVWSGHPRPIVAIPSTLARLWVSSDRLNSVKVPSVASGARMGLSHFGIEPASLEGVMAPLLSGRAGAARLDAYRALARR